MGAEGVRVSISHIQLLHDNKPGNTRHIEKAKRHIQDVKRIPRLLSPVINETLLP